MNRNVEKARGRVIAATLLLASCAASSALLLPAPAADAAGTYSTTGPNVRNRSCASTNCSILRTYTNQGTSVYVRCQVHGMMVTRSDTGARSDVWDYNDGGYTSDLYVSTPNVGTFSPGMTDCNAPTQTNAQKAAAWAAAETRSPDPSWSDDFHRPWSGLCQGFVRVSYLHAGLTTPQYASAKDAYIAAHNEGRLRTSGVPPVGAQTFYAIGTYYHTAVAWGNDTVATTYGNDGQRLNTRIVSTHYFANYLGWAMPRGA
ncbi:MAG: hypothetical protein JWL79_924 [Frankiales bacterium]|nr:hypothetical protein [Frankiales bacterium]